MQFARRIDGNEYTYTLPRILRVTTRIMECFLMGLSDRASVWARDGSDGPQNMAICAWLASFEVQAIAPKKRNWVRCRYLSLVWIIAYVLVALDN